MNIADHIPDDPENYEADAIVVGTGMGGATLGYELSRLGKRVLFVEKGKFLQNTALFHTPPEKGCSEEEIRLLKGRWPDRLKGKTSFGPVEFYGPVGCGTGGSTLLYGAQLERFHAMDFRPKQYFENVKDSSLPEQWPISYNDLLPYYRRAEAHLKVCGTQDPLNPDPKAPLLEAPALSERDEFIFSSMRQSGLNPYRSHVGYHNVKGCWECLDQCLKGCKSDAGTRFLLPAIIEHHAQILPECEVLGLETNGRSVKYIHAVKDGQKIKLKARIVVLAAGAFATPTLLLRSYSSNWLAGLANGSGLVGRNLMLHTSDFLMVDQKENRDATGPVKSITLNDFYTHNGQKLGALQSVGLRAVPPIILSYLRYLEEKDPSWLRRRTTSFLPKISELASKHFQRSSAFSTIVEDLPYRHNGIELDTNSPNGFRFHYTYTKELGNRNKQLLRSISKSLAPNLSVSVVTGSKNNINFGHVCGTCKFGNDPETSVLNAQNRAHEVDNLFVVDASFFPSSAGTNPSLTIAANALRVGEIINEQLN